MTEANRADKLRDLADKMQPAIDNKLGNRLTNTPKRMCQAAYSRLDGDRLRRTQEALRALAAHHEAGNVPPDLVKVTTKKAVYELMGTILDCSNRGYYDAPIDTGEPAKDNPEAVALWALIGEKSAEDRQAEDLRRKIDGLQFSNIPGYFPTPAPVIERMLELAEIQPGQRVLEPSAGSGNIADAIRAAVPSARIDVCERNLTLAGILEAKGFDLLAHDFLELAQRAKGYWDRVVMNPPFENLLDIDHVKLAFECANSGGRVVAVMSPGPFFRDTVKARDFREWLNHLGGEREDLPAGSFKESGTGVASCLVVIDKP